MASPIGHFKMNVSEEDMTPVAPKEAKPRVTTVRSAESSHVGTQLDLRGNATKKHWQKLTNTLMLRF